MKIAVTGPDGAREIRYAHNRGGGRASTRRPRSRARAAGLGSPTSRRFLGFWRALLRSRASDRDDRHGPAHASSIDAWSVVIGNGQFADGGIRLSPRSFPGDGVLDALVFTGPTSDAYRLLPRIFRHGDHVPDPNDHGVARKLKIDVDAAGRCRSWPTGRARDDAGDVPDGAPADPAEDLSVRTATYAGRLREASRRTAEAGSGVAPDRALTGPVLPDGLRPDAARAARRCSWCARPGARR